ncbi:LysR family transcriptional regulator [Reinekea marina]|uniref:LysR family transcriptional regulator n=1 Tax=Reinekea marina TaxID=1310421 RepID=UPI0025B33A65|nr:LysR family transcriptional regulator [Reinekea marina]MDN3650405.1 LysR family transcriptional regulator [Reinekea marina]
MIIRGNNGITLTSAGAFLFDYVRNIESLEIEVLNRIAGYSRANGHGNLRIAAYSSILRSVVMPALAPLIESSNGVHVEFFSRELRDLLPMLKSGEVDFIILDHLLEQNKLVCRKIGEESLIHIKSKRKRSKEAFLDHDSEDKTTFQFFKYQNLKQDNIQRRFYNDIYGIIDGVKLGAGQAIVSKHLISNSDDIEVVPYNNKVSNTVYLYYHEHRFLTDFHQRIIKTIIERSKIFLNPEINK